MAVVGGGRKKGGGWGEEEEDTGTKQIECCAVKLSGFRVVPTSAARRAMWRDVATLASGGRY
jgi:hypothetical protein